jgi:hypothetical protein
MDAYHKAQVLVRNKQYLKELKELQKGYFHDKQESFCKKYGLSIPITPEEASKLPVEAFKHFMPEDDVAVGIATHHKDANSFKKVSSKYVSGKQISNELKGEIECLEFEQDKSLWLRDGRYLTIEIDLKKKKKDIMDGVKQKVDLLSKPVLGKTGRYKKHKFDLWEIYDMRHRSKLNFSQIARKLSGLKGNPAYNEKLDNALQRVKRAYKAADEMRQEVEAQIKDKT